MDEVLSKNVYISTTLFIYDCFIKVVKKDTAPIAKRILSLLEKPLPDNDYQAGSPSIVSQLPGQYSASIPQSFLPPHQPDQNTPLFTDLISEPDDSVKVSPGTEIFRRMGTTPGLSFMDNTPAALPLASAPGDYDSDHFLLQLPKFDGLPDIFSRNESLKPVELPTIPLQEILGGTTGNLPQEKQIE